MRDGKIIANSTIYVDIAYLNINIRISNFEKYILKQLKRRLSCCGLSGILGHFTCYMGSHGEDVRTIAPHLPVDNEIEVIHVVHVIHHADDATIRVVVRTPPGPQSDSGRVRPPVD